MTYVVKVNQQRKIFHNKPRAILAAKMYMDLGHDVEVFAIERLDIC